MTVYGYARVSTLGQSLDTQVRDLEQAGVPKKNIISEKYTGTTTDRPEFKKLLGKLQSGDTLTVTKLDRLARNTSQALNLVNDFNKRGIFLHVLNIGKIDSTPSGRLLFTVFSAFADFERDLIVARTQEGKAYAKKHDPNFKDGRPKKLTDEKLKYALHLREDEHLTYKKIAKEIGVSESTLYKAFRRVREKEEEKIEMKR